MEDDFIILRDTREKKGWNFINSIDRKLETGDYTIEGLENILCIERKQSVAELATNIVSPRFIKELERMAKFPYAFLLCEFNVFDIKIFPAKSNIPKERLKFIRIKPAFILRRLSEIQVKYGIHVIFCGDESHWIALDIMKRVYEHERNNGRRRMVRNS